MIFKDRVEAGKKLAKILLKDKQIIKEGKKLVVFSLLRGGAIVGCQIAKQLSLPHFPLVVKKIGAPGDEELAIGALCGNQYFLDNRLIKTLDLNQNQVDIQIKKAKEKQNQYIKKFIDKKRLVPLVGKSVILVDDGIATGASIKAALKFFKKQKVKKVILAVPVAPTDFSLPGFDRVIILHKDPWLTAVSQFYQDFSQVTDNQVRKIFSLKTETDLY